MLNCNIRASRYKRIIFFMDCRASGRFVRCGFVYITVDNGAAKSCMLPRICVAAHSYTAAHSPCCRAFVCAAHPCFRASMMPRTCILSRISVVAHSSFGRSLVCRRASLVPRVYVLPRTFICGREVLRIAAHSLGATHGKCCRALDMLPRAAGIVVMFGCVAADLPCCRAVLRAAAHPWCHARQNTSTFYVLPRIYTCFVSSPMLPRSGLDCYKMAVSSTDNVDHQSSPSSSSPHHRHHYHHHHA